ncbi:hypothetical protein [Acinetobacter sp. WZC-1]|uniref:hypothetical protein n=1 Tax=Acinetobacter sp. WZC-1 TaxID=3459034 RepID=UPI00403D63DB
MKFNGKSSTLLSLLMCSALLAGCGSDNANYTGPVQGTAKTVSSATESEELSNTAAPVPESNYAASEPEVSVESSAASEPGAVAPDNKVETAPTDQPADAGVAASGPIGEDRRFTEQTPGMTDEAKYVASPAIEYNFGQLVVNGKSDYSNRGQPVASAPKDVRIVPFHGWIRYPQANLNNTTKKFPIIVFLHGQHTPADPSYQGYDYLAQSLAGQGYVVLSIDANNINGSGGDASSQSRAQLVLGTIDKLKQLDEYGGAGVLTALRGKLDFDSIGIMGHSRGGQAIRLAIKFNTARFGNDLGTLKQGLLQGNAENFKAYPDLISAAKDGDDNKLKDLMAARNISFSKTADSVQPYNFKAAFALAPTDFEEFKGLTNVPVATLVPSCDGDVSDLQGVYGYDNNRFGFKYDTAPRYQVLVRGANHNFFNTTWLNDDYSVGNAAYNDTSYCNRDRPDSMRLNPVDQRRIGSFIIGSFMRYFVGDEAQFKSYWNAVGQLPGSACPKGDETCDERVILTMQKNDSKLIQRFEDSSALTTNLLGGLNRLDGFLKDGGIIQCSSFLGFKDTDKTSKCTSPVVPLFANDHSAYTGGLVSFPDQLQLSWNVPNPVYSLSLNNMPTQGYDSLTFRVALPVDVGQEIYVELTDHNGKTARVTASDFSDALYTIPRKKAAGIPLKIVAGDEVYKGKTAEALNMVSIPLKAFKGIDPEYLDKLTFTFPKENGSIVMNDIELQALRN